VLAAGDDPACHVPLLSLGSPVIQTVNLQHYGEELDYDDG
jgi:hypothetical protein